MKNDTTLLKVILITYELGHDMVVKAGSCQPQEDVKLVRSLQKFACFFKITR